ncbi:DUF1769-domain-containing protein [Coniophora puteana RWD-64-598 SS2]|uniref:DUF1769-domain-containing protein n=1 Tax=Coniophora puteana (strain RWD-64-598) TaxID=741705 RepID=A0A5M3MHJ1_CONPW|nr:DUF1769-domain-containing protein [Coniophora puteana RWD-64-598 SS2]EIW78573.1 DUF1769-domain-containing protein [Coniophora puteana RWD-64-598 SS2]
MCHFRVLAGPNPDSLQPITHLVNSGSSHPIASDAFDGAVAVYIKGFQPPNDVSTGKGCEYFEREDRKGVTWSIQVRGRFLQPHSADDVLFGNVFDKPLKLPWGSGAALKFMSYIDPTLSHDLVSTPRPWALSPLVSTMPHLAHRRLDDVARSMTEVFPPKESVVDDASQLHLALTSNPSSSGSTTSGSSAGSSAASSSSSLASVLSKASAASKASVASKASAVKSKVAKLKHKSGKGSAGPGGELKLKNASERRAHFSNVKRRKDIVFGPDDELTLDFCYGYLEFAPSLTLRLPGGISFDLMRFWDRHPVRFVCCERGRVGTPASAAENLGEGETAYGRVFWCVSFELADDGDEGEGVGRTEERDDVAGVD